nr:hypothetical protein [Xanthomonas theicola]
MVEALEWFAGERQIILPPEFVASGRKAGIRIGRTGLCLIDTLGVYHRSITILAKIGIFRDKIRVSSIIINGIKCIEWIKTRRA